MANELHSNQTTIGIQIDLTEQFRLQQVGLDELLVQHWPQRHVVHRIALKSVVTKPLSHAVGSAKFGDVRSTFCLVLPQCFSSVMPSLALILHRDGAQIPR